MSSREAILARIRAAVGDGAPTAPTAPTAHAAHAMRRLTQEELAAGFAERLAEYTAIVHRVAAGGVGEAVGEALSRRQARRVVVPDGVPSAWLVTMTAERIGDDPPLSSEDLDAADGVITGCALAIAETGTIVLDAGPGQGRRAVTLVPDYHLCVVPAERIVAAVPDAIARLDPARPLTWISGPSATSDIELDRVEGVHGPRTLEVLISDE